MDGHVENATKVTLSHNFPMIPEQLEEKLKSVLREIRDHLYEQDLIPTNGLIVQDEKGIRYLLSNINSMHVEVTFEEEGDIQRILKNEKLGSPGPVVPRPLWNGETDRFQCRGSGINFQILGKWVDAD